MLSQRGQEVPRQCVSSIRPVQKKNANVSRSRRRNILGLDHGIFGSGAVSRDFHAQRDGRGSSDWERCEARKTWRHG